jgi:hypothetical protein
MNYKLLIPLCLATSLVTGYPVAIAEPEPVAPIAAASQSVWSRFSPPEGGFSILMPGTPEESNQNVGTEEEPVILRGFRSIRANEGMYLILYQDIPENANERKVKAVLNAFPEYFAKAVKGQLISQKNITLNSYKGKEFKIKGSRGAIFRGRVYVADNRMYLIGVLTTKERYLRRTIPGFLNSFQIGDSAETRQVGNTTGNSRPTISPETLNSQLQLAVCTQNWVGAITIVDRMLAVSTLEKEFRSQLLAYRQRLQGFASSGTVVPTEALPGCSPSGQKKP